MNYTCETNAMIPLDKIFLGQNLSVVVSLGSSATPLNRFEKKWSFGVNNTFTAFSTVKNKKVYISAQGCSIRIHDFDYNIYPLLNLTQLNENCVCGAVAVLKEAENISFAVGCSVTKEILTENGDFMHAPEHRLYFLNYIPKLGEIVNFNYTILNFSPDRMSSNNKINGDFCLLIIDQYDYVDYESFYSNHLLLVTGNVNITTINYKIIYVSDKTFDTSNYYFTDFGSVYDPMFNYYYIYLTDIYFGLRILKFDINNHFKITMSSYAVEYPLQSMAICGQNLYLTDNYTNIYRYLFNNWFTPVFEGIIYPYKNYYSAIPGTLKCSDSNYAKYLLLLVQDSSASAYIHVIDNLATELASIITDQLISNSIVGTFAYFIGPNDLVVITSTDFSFYNLTEFVLNIYTGTNCTENTNYYIEIEAINENNYIHTSFNMSVAKNYYSQNVGITKIPVIGYVAIGLGIVVFVVCGWFVTKFCNRKRNKCTQEPGLFEYEFIEFK